MIIGVIGPSDLALSEKVARSLAETEIPYISYGDFMESEPVLLTQEKTHLNNRFYTGTSLNTRAQVGHLQRYKMLVKIASLSLFVD